VVDARDDEELMAAYKAGDARAYRVLVERHHAPVYRFCLRSLRSPEAAADAAQEVFLRVVKNAPTWERKAKFTTWLYTMARNHCIDEARKARFRRTESLNEAVGKDGDGRDERLDRVASEALGPDRLVDSARLRQVIDAAVAELPAEQREVFLLREHAGLQFKDIAVVAGVGENTVKSRMRYALSALQKKLSEAGFTAAVARDVGSPGSGSAASPGHKDTTAEQGSPKATGSTGPPVADVATG
jgi:RNA polymerase sigma-70 factor (ECF subfamily)